MAYQHLHHSKDYSEELARLLLANRIKTREISALPPNIASKLDKIYNQIVYHTFLAQNGQGKLFFDNL